MPSRSEALREPASGRRKVVRIANKQRFPRLWQVLVLVAAGFLIFFSSCLGAFAGFPNRNSPYPAWLVGGGLLVGGAMFFAGLVLGLVWLILTLTRAFRTPSDAPEIGVVPHPPSSVSASSAAEEEHVALWRLRVAIIVLLVFAGGGPALGLTRLAYLARPYMTFFLVSWLLGEAPYIFALFRLARGPDRLGIAVSAATGCLQFAFLTLETFTRFSPLAGLALFSVTPIAEILIVAFSWQLGRMQPPQEDDNSVLAASFGCVGGYLLLVHFALTYLRPALR